MSINTIIKNLPEKSGIYKMLDNKNSVIYVGKASNLKKEYHHISLSQVKV